MTDNVVSLCERRRKLAAIFRPQPPRPVKERLKQDPDLQERIDRIKASIGRINELMHELKQIK